MIRKFSEIINKPTPVLVDFYAEWCGPCQVMSPILKDVKDQLNDIISIIKINVDKNPVLSGKYQVKGVPTLIIFKEGQLVWRQSGIVRREELIDIINKFS